MLKFFLFFTFQLHKCQNKNQGIFICFQSFKNDQMRENYLYDALGFIIRSKLTINFEAIKKEKENMITTNEFIVNLYNLTFYDCVHYIRKMIQKEDFIVLNNFQINNYEFKIIKSYMPKVSDFSKWLDTLDAKTIKNYLYETNRSLSKSFHRYIYQAIIKQLKKDDGKFRQIINILYYKDYVYDSIPHDEYNDMCASVDWFNMHFVFIDCVEFLQGIFPPNFIQAICDYIVINSNQLFYIYIFNNFHDQIVNILVERFKCDPNIQSGKPYISEETIKVYNNFNEETEKKIFVLHPNRNFTEQEQNSINFCLDVYKLEVDINIKIAFFTISNYLKTFKIAQNETCKNRIKFITGGFNFMLSKGKNMDYGASNALWSKCIEEKRMEFFDIIYNIINEIMIEIYEN